ncbi:hypothetical protein HDU78_003326 [Chytriomyces hyalinus]|nr:hypothetical protein HDU78_003326 [Chytriomyces hyalinus]
MLNVNIQSAFLLLLLTASANATTLICQCLCGGKEFATGESESNCNDWCLVQVVLQGGDKKVCPVGRLEYLEVSKKAFWIYVGCSIAGFVLLVSCCISLCCYCAKRRKAQAANVIVVQQPAAGGPAYYPPGQYGQHQQAEYQPIAGHAGQTRV